MMIKTGGLMISAHVFKSGPIDNLHPRAGNSIDLVLD